MVWSNCKRHERKFLASALNRENEKYKSELSSTATSEGLINVSRVCFNKLAENKKPNRGDNDLPA